jgi:hypothetical protein
VIWIQNIGKVLKNLFENLFINEDIEKLLILEKHLKLVVNATLSVFFKIIQ